MGTSAKGITNHVTIHSVEDFARYAIASEQSIYQKRLPFWGQSFDISLF